MYNPGPAGTYPIKIRVPNHDLNVIGLNGTTIQGDVICPNLKDSNDCELLFNLQMASTSSNYVKVSVSKSGSGSAKIVKMKTLSSL